METFETDTKVETPRGTGVVVGKLASGKIIVRLDWEAAKPGPVVDTWAFWPGELREV
jgi:hypothetical protein